MEDYKPLERPPQGADIFSHSHFLGDVQNLCKALDALYSPSTTRACVEAFSQSFHEGGVVWRATSLPGKGINYRFYERRSVDTFDIATKAGLLEHDHPLIPLLQAWSKPWDGHTPQQSCDFDPEQGLNKTWVYMDGFRSLESILSFESVPEVIVRLKSTFQDHGLDLIRHIAIDWHCHTVNFYFRVTGPMTNKRITDFANLANCPPESKAEYTELQKYLGASGFTFGLTIASNTGAIKRVAFYALGLPYGELPDMDDPLREFFAVAPNYDEEEFTAVAWSFGERGGKYMKGEKSYCGKVMPLLRSCGSALKSDGDKAESVPLLKH